LLNKAAGISSNHALQQARRLFQAKKAGHTGTLDPLATGMLIVCFGQATKFAHYLLDADKTYAVTAHLGITTDTLDADGQTVATRRTDYLTEPMIHKALLAFEGTIEQVPPMYSALKHQGKPLYVLARAGQAVERKKRTVTLHALTDISWDGKQTLHFTVRCSKGTYIRTLVDDLGRELGCGAHVAALHRLSIGQFEADGMETLTELSRKHAAAHDLLSDLLPVHEPLAHLRPLTLDAAAATAIRHGQVVACPDCPEEALVTLWNKEGEFLGLGMCQAGQLSAKRLMATASEAL
jgi:tRNA pseudouridine55 synthase